MCLYPFRLLPLSVTQFTELAREICIINIEGRNGSSSLPCSLPLLSPLFGPRTLWRGPFFVCIFIDYN